MTKSEIDAEEFPSEEDLNTQKKSIKSEKKHSQTVKEDKPRDEQADSKKVDTAVVDKLLDKNQELEAQLKEAQDKYLRAEAEIQNIKKHNQQDQAALIKYDGQKLATAILPSLDNLQRALTAQEQNQDTSSQGIITGVEMVLKHLKQALAENNVVEIEAQDQKFDPTVHQAVQTVPADDQHPAETVVQVLQDGYKLKDRVIRPSMVVVAQ
ncbi:nucleotide exchange factor GrpE [Bombilactobacillus bombi]|uniref:nucleotide exchange factor GrpE n=1 Tax=Bombilactobacillus bombi TaxID=1303590 RepID=UPI001F082312|nr:nucleotide exchange factor GrpE [Bombilactobacillus bombi]